MIRIETNPGRLRCWVFGHRVDDVAAEHGYYECVYCDQNDCVPIVQVQAYTANLSLDFSFRGLLCHARCIFHNLKGWVYDLWDTTDLCPECREPRFAGCRPWCSTQNDIPF